MNLFPYSAYKPSSAECLGDIPAHWDTVPVKRAYSIQLGKMLQNLPKSSQDFEVPYLKALHVQWAGVTVDDVPTMWASPSEVHQYSVKPGDLLVCEGGEGGRCSIVVGKPEGCIIQNALHRVRATHKGRNDYLQYVMFTLADTGYLEAINDKATIAHFTREKFAALRIPLPPFAEQTAIVRYLEQADDRVRCAISAKERLTELLIEQRQAVIHRAVTRGLHPNVQLKDSGVEWLGDVPKHWNVMPIKRAFTSMDYGISESASTSGPVRLLTMGHLSQGRVTVPPMGGVNSVAESLLLKKGDLLFNRTNSQELVGKVGLFVGNPSPVTFASYLVRLRPNSRHNSEYLNTALNDTTILSLVRREAIPSLHQSNLNPSRYGRIKVPLPPLQEQISIVEHLDKATSDIDTAIDKAQRQIDLLREYRTRLIADVVTGQVDVRGAVGDEVELPVS